MDADSFNELALRVIAGEATPDERAALERELAGPGDDGASARRESFTRLQRGHALLLTTAPLAGAALATEPALPAHRVNELRTAVRQHFGPVSLRPARQKGLGLLPALRWLFAGGGVAALAAIVLFFSFANRTVEVGLYATSLTRDGARGLTAQDVPSAKVLTFQEDAPFDLWQNEPLAWYEHAKVWVDNENDQLHIVHRVRHGEIVVETWPLAPTDDAQRAQIRDTVQALEQP